MGGGKKRLEGEVGVWGGMCNTLAKTSEFLIFSKGGVRGWETRQTYLHHA